MSGLLAKSSCVWVGWILNLDGGSGGRRGFFVLIFVLLVAVC